MRASILASTSGEGRISNSDPAAFSSSLVNGGLFSYLAAMIFRVLMGCKGLRAGNSGGVRFSFPALEGRIGRLPVRLPVL